MAKRALGRGIDALLKSVPSDSTPIPESSALKQISIDLAQPNKDQPRKHFDEEALAELAESVKEKGILQPILVEHIDSDQKKYQIVAGERRYRAAKIAGLKEIPVIIKEFTPEDKLEIALIENVQREDLTPIEEAKAYLQLAEELGLNQDEIAKKIGKNRSTVANSLRLLKLPGSMQQALDDRTLSSGHARAILTLKNPSHMDLLFREIIKNGISVREAEKWAQERNSGHIAGSSITKPKTAKHRNPAISDLEQQLIERFGTKVNISGSEKKGKIEISYFSLDDLNRLFDILAKS